ncbi:hypothetical protein ACRAWF_14715 [Streptomyces sp. L7]
MSSAHHPRFRAFTPRDLDGLLKRVSLSVTERLALRAVSSVLPFRTNSYVVDELIDWSAVPDDPIFRLTFPQAGMLPEPDLQAAGGPPLPGGAEGRSPAHGPRDPDEARTRTPRASSTPTCPCTRASGWKASSTSTPKRC